MSWLFLLFVLDTSAGEVRPRVMIRQVFADEANCNALGRALALQYADNSLKSFSICLPRSVFDDREMQTDRLDR